MNDDTLAAALAVLLVAGIVLWAVLVTFCGSELFNLLAS
jgi:hypothetical protein